MNIDRHQHNIALGWFVQFGQRPPHDLRTLRNVTEPGFIAHAKQSATADETAAIDASVAMCTALIAASECRQRLTNHISQVAGVAVEITVRAERSFTYSFAGINDAAAQRIVAFFGGMVRSEVVADAECGTFVYIDLL